MKNFISVLFILFLTFCNNSSQKPIDYGSNPRAGKYMNVNDIRLYYEIYGEGEPLLLLHDNGGSIESFEFQIPELSKHYKVIAVDSRAQGRSYDSEAEITYTLMASDMSELIRKMNLGSVDVLGFSDGGNIGLELAFAHPELVKKLIAVGANYTHKDAWAESDNVRMDPNDQLIIKMSPLLKKSDNSYKRLSPNPEKELQIRKKLNSLEENYPNFTLDQLKSIQTPSLIVAGDHDIVKLDQTISLFNSLPHAQLFIVPGASHLASIEQPELINSVVLNFLKTHFRDIDNEYFFR